MTQRYYTGTKLKTLLSGDKVLGRDLIKKARAYTGYLFDQLTENQKYRTQQWNDPNGSKIQVFVWNDVLGKRAIARIFVPEITTSAGIEIVCTFTGGLFSVVGFTTGNAVQLLGEEDRTLEYSFLTSSDAGATWDIGDFESTSLFLPQFQDVDPSSKVPYPYSAPGKHSGNYSGTMREIVQLLAGQSYPIRYQYSWPITHGIFINQTTQQKWVIEIAATGITAWPLPVCTNLVGVGETVPTDLTEIPVSTTLPGPSGRTRLCNASEVADAYACSPMTTEHGWAFSYSGHEAQHVLFKYGYGAGGVEGGNYKKAFRYKITIVTDIDGNPESASMSLEESEMAWSNHIQNYVRVPKWTDCGPALQRYMFEPLYVDPMEEDFTFPIYVYYDGESAKIIRYEILTEVTSSLGASSPGSGYDHADCLSWINSSTQLGTIYSQGGTETKWGANILGVHEESSGNYNIISRIYPAWRSRTVIENTSGPLMGAFGSIGSTVYGTGVYLAKYASYNTTISENNFWCIAFPFFEREGYYLQRKGTYTEETTNMIRVSKRWAGATYSDSPPVGGSWIVAGSPTACITDSSYVFSSIPSTLDCSAGTDLVPTVDIGTTLVPIGGTSIYFLGSRQTCCAENKTRYKWYVNENRESNTIICTSDVGTEYSDPPEASFTFIVDGYDITESLEDSSDKLFSSSVTDDISDCPNVGSPYWMGAWLDVFTGNGWISPAIDSETTSPGDKHVVGTVGYDLDNLPAETRASGWFGKPFV